MPRQSSKSSPQCLYRLWIRFIRQCPYPSPHLLRTRPVLFEINLHRHLRLLFAEQWKDLSVAIPLLTPACASSLSPLSSSIRSAEISATLLKNEIKRCFRSAMVTASRSGSEQPGDGDSNSIEPRAVQYELSVGNGDCSFNERDSAGTARTSGLRYAAHGIQGRCDRLRAAQNLHRDLSRRRHGLFGYSEAAVIAPPVYARGA